MKERPILFSAPMVRSLLDGSKTQTRRVLKQATGPSLSVGIDDETGMAELSWLWGNVPGHDVHETVKRVPCPYGQPGDRLWVRETFAKIKGQTIPWIETDYRATYTHGDRLGDTLGIKKRWTPAIHMPRDASRITLEITGVRVERLQDISEADAQAEGITKSSGGYWDGAPHKTKGTPRALNSAQAAYRDVWSSINGQGSWDENPWVWCVEFKVVKP